MTPTFFETPKAFRAWLSRNHAKSGELWVGFYKKETGRPSITWPAALIADSANGLRIPQLRRTKTGKGKASG